MPRAVRFQVRRFATLPSTNDWLLAEARRGAPPGLVAVADHQSAGRGRLGRTWEAPPGGALLVSVLLRPVAPPGALYACTAAVALAGADACASVASVEPGIKWPNDLVLPPPPGRAAAAGNGGPHAAEEKLAGVLAESDPAAEGGARGSVAVVVGMGLNVDWAPAGATCLSAHVEAAPDAPPLLGALLDAYLGALGPRVALLDGEAGRARVLDELRGRCVTLGRHVRVDLGAGGVLEGVATAVDDDGRLVVAPADGAHGTAVAAGDVVHLRAAPQMGRQVPG